MATIFSNIKDRVLQIPENKGITKEYFFDKIGVTYGNFKGKAKEKALSSDTLATIVTMYPDINPNWLLTGQGEMFIKINTNQSLLLEDPASEYVKSPIKSRFKKLPNRGELIKFYDVDFAAGDVEFYNDNNTITPAYTMDIPEFSGCTAFRTYNNSMEKLIYSGDILFATEEHDWRESLEYGQIYGIVCNNNRKYLKYIRRAEGKEDSHFLLKSENAAEYDEFTLAKNKVKSIWLIHGWLKKRV
jgi:phage repressor protein C with HTH and peptisase S24 domain